MKKNEEKLCLFLLLRTKYCGTSYSYSSDLPTWTPGTYAPLRPIDVLTYRLPLTTAD